MMSVSVKKVQGIGLLAVLAVGLVASPRRIHGAEADVEAAVALENAFTAVVDRAKPAVVVISNKQLAPRGPHGGMPPEMWRFFGPPGQQPPNQPPPNQQPRQRAPQEQRPRVAGKGSGVIIRADGYVITNYHVIKDWAELEVRLADGRIFDTERNPKEVEVIGVDEETDLAILRIGDGALTDLPTLPFADSDTVRVGAWAIAIGAPFDLDYSVTIGNVSQKGRHDVGMTTFENYIQTDASINPGNSGGPLLNIRGEIMGINEFIFSRGGGSVGLGFAIASNLVEQVTNNLIEHGEVLRPFLGISMDMLDESLKKHFGVEWGVLVSEALPGDPAEKAGVRAGDVITKIGGKEVRTPHDLLFAVLAYEPGDEIGVELIRDGDTRTVQIIAKQRPTRDGFASRIGGRQGLLDKVGISVEADADGVFVAGVVTGSPAERADMRRGDRILEVNRVAVKDVEGVVRALKQSKENVIVFYVDRRGSKRYIGVELESPAEDER